jgi:ketosteroid isomerase-like protein
MAKCPKCGQEIEEGDDVCRHCGARLTPLPQEQSKAGSSSEDEVKNTVIKRLDGIKNRDEGVVRALMDESYSKFDDWPPFGRQDAAKALENEFSAFKVLSNYTYELKDFQTNILGDTAVATFTVHYQATMRNRPFDVNSRVTTVLRKQDSGWKVVHEHYSRFPEETRQQFYSPRRSMQP